MALGQLARVTAPLAQLPPRGGWKQSGGVVYNRVDRWLGAELVEPGACEVADIVRRYLRAFGPSGVADLTAWSGLTRLGPVVAAMDDLVRHEDERGGVLYDVAGADIVEEDVAAPVRLLGIYDNLWLAHAGRDRVTTPAARRRWTGPNGGTPHTVFVDGWLAGMWRVDRGRVRVVETFRELTRAEQTSLEEESARVDAMLAR